jgi:hypothetical protein
MTAPPLHEAKLKWQKITNVKEQIEAQLMSLLRNPETTDEEVLQARDMYRGVCTTYLDTKELLCITYPQAKLSLTYPWHVRG